LLRAEGYISAIDEKLMQAKVKLPKHGDIETDWLQIMNRNAGIKDYFNYDEKVYVACIMDDNLEDGWIIGTLEPEDVSFDESGKDIYYKKFTDGTLIKYDRKAHKLSVELKGDGEITIDKKLTVKVSNGYEIQGDVKITGKLEVKEKEKEKGSEYKKEAEGSSGQNKEDINSSEIVRT